MNYLVSVAKGESFNNTAKSIIDQLNNVEYGLTFERKFDSQAKDDLDQALLAIPDMIDHLAKASLQGSTHFLGMSISRIVLLGNIEQKVQGIRELIQPLSFFPLKKKTCVLTKLDEHLPLLKTNVQKIMSSVIGAYRLPFGSFGAWDDYYYSVENSLNGETRNLHQLQAKHIEIFHLLADQFDEAGVKSVDAHTLAGSYELHATISYSRILSELLTVSSVRKEVVQFLLDRVNEAKQIALKTTYLNFMEKNKSLDSRQAYFSDLHKLVYDGQYFTLDRLNQIYKLSLNNCPIPVEVVLGDVCHDLVKMIADVKPGDKRIFCAGTAYHQVLIEMECNEEQEFFYTIFNTGEGSEIDLEINIDSEDEEFTKPRTYRGLKRETFNYEFFEKLLMYSVDKSATIEDFYNFHFSQLITQARGVFDHEYAPIIRSQYFEICTYAVLDEWINSYLQEEEITEKERIKVDQALRKQNQAISTIFSSAVKRKSSAHGIVRKESKQPDMLKQALRLKELCEEYQNHLGQREDDRMGDDDEMSMIN